MSKAQSPTKKKEFQTPSDNVRGIAIPPELFNYKLTWKDKLLDFLYENPATSFIFDCINAIGTGISIATVPVICIKHYLKLCQQAIMEIWYYKKRPYDSLISFQRNFRIISKPQTIWLLKEFTFFHNDKPEMLDRIIINAFNDWYYKEGGRYEYMDPDKARIRDSINNELKQFNNNYLNMDSDKALKKQTELANKIWAFRKSLWT